MAKEEGQTLELKDQLRNILEEARMVLPGVQALFGFQLVAVFQTTFRKELSPLEARLHLAAIALAALSAALVIAPAAVHRRTRPARVAPSLLRLSSRLLTWSTWPLALAVFLDFGLLARLVLGNGILAWSFATGLLAAYIGLWVLLPAVFAARQERDAG